MMVHFQTTKVLLVVLLKSPEGSFYITATCFITGIAIIKSVFSKNGMQKSSIVRQKGESRKQSGPNFLKKITLLNPLYAYVRVRIRG